MRSLVLSSVALMLGMSAFAGGPVPRPAPNLDILDSSGKHFVLANNRGKVVVVQFLLTTCPHCQAFSQLLDRLQAEYGPKGFQAVGGGFDPATMQMAKDYHDKYAQAFPVGPVPRETVLTFMGASVMDRIGAPQIAVIDRKGQIREQSSSDYTQPQPLQNEQHLRALIEKLLAEPGGLSASKASGKAVATANK